MINIHFHTRQVTDAPSSKSSKLRCMSSPFSFPACSWPCVAIKWCREMYSCALHQMDQLLRSKCCQTFCCSIVRTRISMRLGRQVCGHGWMRVDANQPCYLST